jgi:hypothetical protein
MTSTSIPVSLDAGLGHSAQEFMVLQRRIPETHSATAREHQWHDMNAPGFVINVGGMKIGGALSAAEELLKRAPDRSDTIYRVILREKINIERLVTA